MTQSWTEHLAREFGGRMGNGAGLGALDERRESHGELLEQVRETALRLVTATPVPPRSLRLRAGEVSVEMDWPDSFAPVPAPAVEPRAVAVTEPAGDTGLGEVCSTTVGVFYHAPEPGAPPFVEPGDRIEPGQQIGVIEVMKLMVAVTADEAGTAVALLAANGESVEFGQPLLSFRRD
ncbi:biotin/lipoyl-containing protein [Amycolatopsis sp. TNS106]|uniref:acetyl-CoA carboxylase biotin carboxyl carrier protein n=1 Tax=Amycolatopsis sp. TNS106 TaxID=2861750 RepID=UPI001C58F908|nr:biotin/lipoyl-containing protein [Amycolatopsis sp. TNS106]QXV61244.1 acetyl-CoA carboxylase biotin carboxyl carrier protein subunit [Amycolatopsis sp. TNS106]